MNQSEASLPLQAKIREVLVGLGQLRYMPPLTAVSCFALVALFVPTFYKLFSFGWKNADYSHGPLVLAAFVWLMWRRRESLRFSADDGSNILPLLTLLFGLVCYALGSMHGSMAIEAFAIVPVFLGASGFLFGKTATKAILFPALFLFFLVPPPLVLTDMLTSPLKMFVATASAALLKLAGYAVSRNGAVILINDYTIVVGDPCSGLRSLIALMAVGALYAQLQASSRLKRSVLFLSVIPISILANIVRLIMLCLITCYLGEAAAEGFLHGFSGFLLFVISLVCLVLVDVAIERGLAHVR
jgi:exosortase